MMLLWLFTASTLHIWPACTLASDYIAMVINCTTCITVAWLTTITWCWQPIRFWHTLIAILANYSPFTHTFAGMLITARIVNGTEQITRACLTTQRIIWVQIPEAIATRVTSSTNRVFFAVTWTGRRFFFGVWVTDTFIDCTACITIACYKEKESQIS